MLRLICDHWFLMLDKCGVYVRVNREVSITAGITSTMRNKKATQKSGFCFSEHCRACTKQCSEITKDAVQSTAFLLLIAEDSKGKTLSEADASLRSSQSRSGRHILPSRRYKPQRLYAVWIASGEKKFRLFLFFVDDCQKLSKLWGYFAAK